MSIKKDLIVRGVQELALIERMETLVLAIKECQDLSEIKKMDDQACALQAAVKASKLGPEMEKEAKRVKMESLFRLGEILLKIDGKVKPLSTSGKRGLRGNAPSERGNQIKAHDINKGYASAAMRIANGGAPLKKRIMKDGSMNLNKMYRIAPKRCPTKGNHTGLYNSDVGRSTTSELSIAKHYLRKVAAMPLKQVDPRDRLRVKQAVIECQELCDAILQQLE
jgi:hypothetical protein